MKALEFLMLLYNSKQVCFLKQASEYTQYSYCILLNLLYGKDYFR